MRQTQTTFAKMMQKKFRRLRVLADVAKQPSLGIGPLPIERALGKLDGFGNFLIAQAAKEFQHDNVLQFRIFHLQARQTLRPQATACRLVSSQLVPNPRCSSAPDRRHA